MTQPCTQVENIVRLDERIKVAEAIMKDQSAALTALTKELEKLRHWGSMWVLLLVFGTFFNNPQLVALFKAVAAR